MKKLPTLLLATAGLAIANAQEKQPANLENIYKVEIGLQGISAGTELPISNKFIDKRISTAS